MQTIAARRILVLAYLVLVLSASISNADISATVNVDAANVRAVMSPLGIGIHTSQYYNDMANPLLDERLEEAGVTALRNGGGGYADVNHWSIVRAQWLSGLTGGGFSPWWGDPNSFGYIGPDSDCAGFVRVLDQVANGQAVVTVNYGSALKLVPDATSPSGVKSVVPDFGGQPKEAAAWVSYANADAGIYGTPSDIAIGVDQQGNDWKTAGYWARLRASTGAEYQTWAQADGVYEPLNRFLAINRDAPVGIKYWEIGNETFGTGYYGGGNGYSVDYDVPYDGTNRDDHFNLSPAQYGQEVVEYAQLMKSIDPTIKIGAVLATPPDDYSWSYADLNDNGFKNSNEPYWNDEVLSQSGIAETVDFVMVHWYPWIGNNDDGSNAFAAVRTKIPHMINGTTAGLDSGTNRGLRDSLQAHGLPDAEIMVTEFNTNGSLQGAVYDAAKSIFVADAYASWLELGVTSVQFLEMLTVNGDFLDGSTMERGTAFYGISMVDKLAKPGDEYVNATTTNNNVRTHAALRADGSIAVMLLNLDLTSTANVTVNLANFDANVNGTRYLLTSGLTLMETAISGLGTAFNANLPARSIATYIIEPVPSLLGDFDADGDVDGRDFLEWQRGNSPNPFSVGDLADWQANYGVAGLSASIAVPEATTLSLMSMSLAGLLLGRRRYLDSLLALSLSRPLLNAVGSFNSSRSARRRRFLPDRHPEPGDFFWTSPLHFFALSTSH